MTFGFGGDFFSSTIDCTYTAVSTFFALYGFSLGLVYVTACAITFGGAFFSLTFGDLRIAACSETIEVKSILLLGS